MRPWWGTRYDPDSLFLKNLQFVNVRWICITPNNVAVVQVRKNKRAVETPKNMTGNK